MSLIDLKALDAVELQTDPFDYIVVPDFLPPDALRQVNGDYPAIDTATNHELRDLSYGPNFQSLLAELQSNAFRTQLGERRMLQYNFLSNSVLAQINQKIGRIGTHFNKRVLGNR